MKISSCVVANGQIEKIDGNVCNEDRFEYIWVVRVRI